MKDDNLTTLFKDLKDDFDTEVPSIGHENRFMQKLQNQEQRTTDTNSTRRSWWKPLMSIAASVALIVSVFTILQQEPEVKDLASVSPELSETQDFFTATIAEELSKLESERNPETEALFKDAMTQMSSLEKEYETLKIDLTESGDDKRVIYAMISNFQNRIELLQTVLENIEDIKQLKLQSNEDSISI